MTTEHHLARLGAVAAFIGALMLLVATLLHPMTADPNDPAAAFGEYAADAHWVASHLGQFLGVAVLGTALVALARSVEPGPPAAWARIGVAGTSASVATAAVPFGHVGDRKRHSSVHETGSSPEVGLASLLGIVFGLTVAVFGIAMLLGRRFPAWLGWLRLAGGVGSVAVGIAQAHTGFSGSR